MILKKKCILLLLSITVMLSFSFIKADTSLAANISTVPEKSNKTTFQMSDYSRVIPAGETTYLSEDEYIKIQYEYNNNKAYTTKLKIKPSYSGYVCFRCEGSNKVQLCDSKGHPLSPWRSVDGSDSDIPEIHFGVKGRTTYYLKVHGKGIYAGEGEGFYDTVNYYNMKSTGKFGKTANTAAKIQGDTYHHGFLQSTSNTKYYTFKKRASKVECFIPYYTDGTLKATITITAKGMKKYRKVIFFKRQDQYDNSEGRYFIFRTPGKKKKNIKIIIKMDHSKNSSGAFSLRYH